VVFADNEIITTENGSYYTKKGITSSEVPYIFGKLITITKLLPNLEISPRKFYVMLGT
jgi:hypothetical protein